MCRFRSDSRRVDRAAEPATFSNFDWSLDQWLIETAHFASALPLLGLAAQVPLWTARALWGWRLAIPVTETSISKLGVRDLLICTAICAAALGWARAGLMSPMVGLEFVSYLSLAVPLVMAGLIIALPAAVIVFRAKSDRSAMCGLVLAQVVAVLFGVGVLSLTAAHPFPDRLVRPAIYLSVIFSVLDSSLLALRRLGYRLHWCGSRPAHTSPEVIVAIAAEE